MYDTPWNATIKRWKTEGLPNDTNISDYFDWDFAFFGADCTPRFPVRTIEKNERFIIRTTPEGGVRKNFIDYTTTPVIIDYPIKTKEDWNEIKKRLKPDFTRVDWASTFYQFNEEKEKGRFTLYSTVLGYDCLQRYIRSDNLLIAMVEDPDWIKEMIMTIAELNLVMLEFMMKNGFSFNGIYIANDMGYKNGLLFSPDIYLKTHYQADKMTYGFCHSKNLKVVLHSCGNVKELIPILIDAGLDCLQPLEVKAQMDLIELKEKFGDRLSFMGGIDSRLMSDPDKTKIEQEVKTKIGVAKKKGGYVYHSDHSIPNIVSFKDYCFVMELVKKYGVYEQTASLPDIQLPESKKEEIPSEPKKIKFGFGRKKKDKITVSQSDKTEQSTQSTNVKIKQPSEKKSKFGFLKAKKK